MYRSISTHWVTAGVCIPIGERFVFTRITRLSIQKLSAVDVAGGVVGPDLSATTSDPKHEEVFKVKVCEVIRV